MHIFILAIYQNIIKVDYCELANEWFEHLVHQTHESAMCISETEQHHQPFIQASFGLERCFPFIPFIDSNLIVATFKINLIEESGPMKLIRKVLQPWYRKAVRDSDFVDCSTIHTHPH